MDKITGRVLHLPAAVDVQEEAARAGIDPALLAGFASGFGAELVKLSGLTEGAAGALQAMISPPAGLAVVYPESRKSGVESRELPLPLGEGRGEGGPRTPETRNPTPTQDSTQSPVLSPHHSVLLAGTRPLLLDDAARLEASPSGPERAAGAELRLTLERYDGRHLGVTRFGDFALEWGRRTYVMGIINVTPDSFSGDGLGVNADAAVAQALRFVEEGADILDVGGESTRPGSQAISTEEEIARVVPVIERLAKEVSVPISVDSYRAETVRAALDAGATIVNDIWGLKHDAALADLAVEYQVPLVLMHNRRATPEKTHLGGHFKGVEYNDLMGELIDELRESVDLALQHGVKPENVIVDPGIGFGKTPAHNIVVMRRQRELKSLGYPILMGTSRKSFIGLTLGLPVDDRVEGTGATVTLSISNGADIVRVHDVKQMARMVRMTDAIVRAASGE